MAVLWFEGWYSPAMCQRYPDIVFVFGDNQRRVGMGGQAVIRNEPNSIGVVTKRVGDMHRDSFFRDGNAKDRAALDADLEALRLLLVAGKDVLIPVERGTRRTTIGCERARLPQYAPALYDHLSATIAALAEQFGSAVFLPGKVL